MVYVKSNLQKERGRRVAGVGVMGDAVKEEVATVSTERDRRNGFNIVSSNFQRCSKVNYQ
jgi:hypothetical protein